MVSLNFSNKALYTPGVDRRLNICDLPEDAFGTRVRQTALSVACMVDAKELKHNPFTNTYMIDRPITLTERMQAYHGCPLGENEMFRGEPTLGFATAFLVGKKIALTAAHAVSADLKQVNNICLVFEFWKIKSNDYKQTFSEQEVYSVKKVIHHCYSREKAWEDWSLLKLDREVRDRTPLKIDFSQVKLATSVFLLGHPTVLPLKYTGRAFVRKNEDPSSFSCDLDAFCGNSGSPVIAMNTGNVVGILCSGNADYEIDTNYDGKGKRRCKPHCVTDKEIEQNGYERCQRLSHLDNLRSSLNKYLTKPQPGLSIIYRCQNGGCTLFNKKAYSPRGMGDFNLAKEFCRIITCSYCSDKPESTTQIVFYFCEYAYTAMQNNDEEQKTAKIQEQGARYDLNGWKYFDVHVTPL